MQRIPKALILLMFSVQALAAAQDGHHGQVRTDGNGVAHAWSESQGDWISPEAFWLEYAQSKGGLTWGRGSDYPEYAAVSEHDLFLVETGQGPCLMEFFHNRWRRANDVRRWDDAFNDLAGCPYVFD